MAGDWTPLRDNIHDDPAIYAMAEMLKVRDADLIVGKVTRFWAWASQHSADGILEGVTRARIDGIAKKPGMADAMLAAGWLEESGGVLIIPRFDRWMSRGAKARLGETVRKKIQRSVPKTSGRVSGQKRDHSTVQYRTEEKDPCALPAPSAPPAPNGTHPAERFVADRAIRTGNTPPGFAEFIARYPAGRATNRVGALEQWRASVEPSDAPNVLAGLETWLASEQFREGYAPKAEKFLRERHWEQPPPAPKAAKGGGGWL